MRLFGRKATIIVHHEYYENVDDAIQAINKLADGPERFQVRTVVNRDGKTLYEIIYEEKI